MDRPSAARPANQAQASLAPGSLAALAAAAAAKTKGGADGNDGANSSPLRTKSYASARANVTVASGAGASKLAPSSLRELSAPAAVTATAATTATAPSTAPRALQLVRLNPRTGQMEVGSEALAALRACKGPVGVVAVAGRARSGKSFVLNAILRRAAAQAAAANGGGDGNTDDADVCSPGGFALAHSYRPCTKGLWLWSTPVGPIDSLTGQQQAAAGGGNGDSNHPRSRRNNNQHHLVLLDTEGIDAYDQTTTDGVRIFALAVLLSSLFVFNQFGAIDEAALDRLSLVTELTRHIRVRAGGGGEGSRAKRQGAGAGKAGGKRAQGEDDEEEEEEEEERRMRQLGAVNPRLLWLLRDFYFDLDEDGEGGGSGFDDEEEVDDEAEEEEAPGAGFSARAPPRRLRASAAALCPGDVRASATFEGGWPPPPSRGGGTGGASLSQHEEEEDERGGRANPRCRRAPAAALPRTTPRDYLEAALAPARPPRPHGGQHQQQQHAAALAAKNAVRQSIKRLFPDRDCFTLVRPVGDERALRRLDSLPASQLRPEFRSAVSRLARLVLERAGPKTVAGGNVVTGPVLAGLAEAYVAAINAGAVPTIATAWQGVAERECARARREAEDAYASEFGISGAVLNEPEALDAEHRRALGVARRVFAEEAVGGEEEEGGGGEDDGNGNGSARSTARRSLETSLERRFGLVRARVLADADAHAERLLAEGKQRVSAAARLGAGGWRDVSGAVAAVEQEYSASAGGTAKWPRLLQFVREAYDAAGAEVAERLKAAAEARIERAELAAREARAEARELGARAEGAERKLEEQQRRVQQQAASAAVGGAYHSHASTTTTTAGPQNGLLAWLGCFNGGGGGGASKF
jgi:hypothetical protein